MKKNETMELYAKKAPNGKSEMSMNGDMEFVIQTFSIMAAKMLHLSNPKYRLVPEEEFLKLTAPTLTAMMYKELMSVDKVWEEGLNGNG